MNTYTMEGAVVDHPVVVYKYETDRATHTSYTTWRGSNPRIPYNPRNLPAICEKVYIWADLVTIHRYTKPLMSNGYLSKTLARR